MEVPKLVKKLAAMKKEERDDALELVAQVLPSQAKLSEEHARMLWEGMFFCEYNWHLKLNFLRL